jgi:hypothetical protein
MPRPTPAQLAYGSLTVVLSTFAMLMLFEAQSGLSVMVIAVVGLVLGLSVAVTATVPLTARARARAARSGKKAAAPASSARTGVLGPETRIPEHSLHG